MSEKLVQLMVNGECYELVVDTRRTLLNVLREDLTVTGTKRSCRVGECGVCTVLLDDKPVNSCLVLAVSASGKKITTIEGLSKGGPHPIQQAFVHQGALQCGYCTPGLILTAKALLDQNPSPTEGEIRKFIAGNLCRCTGYVKIVAAIKAAADQLLGEGR